jgi:hypothetical protein
MKEHLQIWKIPLCILLSLCRNCKPHNIRVQTPHKAQKKGSQILPKCLKKSNTLCRCWGVPQAIKEGVTKRPTFMEESFFQKPAILPFLQRTGNDGSLSSDMSKEPEPAVVSKISKETTQHRLPLNWLTWWLQLSSLHSVVAILNKLLTQVHFAHVFALLVCSFLLFLLLIFAGLSSSLITTLI